MAGLFVCAIESRSWAHVRSANPKCPSDTPFRRMRWWNLGDTKGGAISWPDCCRDMQSVMRGCWQMLCLQDVCQATLWLLKQACPSAVCIQDGRNMRTRKERGEAGVWRHSCSWVFSCVWQVEVRCSVVWGGNTYQGARQRF